MAEKILLSVEFDSAEAEKRAANLRKQVADLANQRRELNKAIRENAKQEAQLTQAIQEQQSKLSSLIAAGKQNTDEYQKAEKQLSALKSELTRVNNAQDEYIRQLNNTENAQKVTRRELNLLNREAQAATGSLNQQRAQLAQLNRAYDQFQVGITGTEADLKALERQIQSLTAEISEQEQATGRFQRNVGNYAGGIREAFAGAIPGGQALTAAFTGPQAAIAGAVAGIGAASKAIYELQQRIEGQRREVQLLTQVTGQELDVLTAKTAATAQTFDVDFNQVLQTTNTLTRELGGSFAENSDLIAQGLAVAGSQGDQFLDVIREYPAQFRAVEISAEEAIAIATQSIQEGIFSDKGADAIKEAGLRLRELPKATREALDGIGLSSAEIEKGLREGTTTVFEQIQRVSERLDELPPQSAEVGAAVAGIFGGAGEDAGLRYLTTLKNINTSLDETVEGAGKFARQQLELQQVNADIELSFNRLLGGADGFFTEATIGAKRFIADGLRDLIIGLEGIINYFIDLYNESLAFRAIFTLVVANVKNAFTIIGGLIGNIVDGFKNLGAIIEAVFTGQFSKIPELIEKTIRTNVENLKDIGEEVVNNYIEGANNAIRAKKIEPFSFEREAAKKEAYEQGLEVGEALAEGVAQGSAGVGVTGESGEKELPILQSINKTIEGIDLLKTKLEQDGPIIEEGIEKVTNPDPEGETDGDEFGKYQRAAAQFGAFADGIVARQDEMIEAEARRALAAQMGGQATEEQIEREIERRKAQSNSYQVAKAAQKAAALAEITIARARQISEVQVAAAKIASSIPPPAGPIIAGVYVAAQVAAAIADTRRRLAEVSALAYGGYSTGGERMQITHEGRIVKQQRSYANGGTVTAPTLALTGERGPEYVAPNAQISRYPQLFSWLDRERNRPGLAFASGGYTASVPAFADGGLTARAAQATVTQQLQVQANLDLANSIENMPAPRVVVEDIRREDRKYVEVISSGEI